MLKTQQRRIMTGDRKKGLTTEHLSAESYDAAGIVGSLRGFRGPLLRGQGVVIVVCRVK